MSGFEKEELQTRTKGMTPEEQTVVAGTLPDNILLGELCRRYIDPGEDKQKILDLLLPALQATRSLHDLKALTYLDEAGFEGVMAEFGGGWKKYANTAADSGIAMIRDTLRQIV